MVSNNDDSWAARCEKVKRQFQPTKKHPQSLCTGSIRVLDNPALSLMIDSMNVSALVLSPNGNIVQANVCATRLLASTKSNMIGSNLIEFLSAENEAEYQTLFDSCTKLPNENINHGAKEVQLRCNDGHVIDVDLSISSLIANENDVYLIAILHDLTVHKVKQEKLRRLANIDTLTDLYNRRAFRECYATAWQNCINEREPLCMLIIDVDYFKQFNDTHGHLQGDECLRKMGKAITACLPTPDALATRYGGDEFIIVLPRNAYNMSHIVAVRLQRSIEQLSFDDIGLGSDVGITISIGIAQSNPKPGDIKENLIQRADEALLKAKRMGRNTIVKA